MALLENITYSPGEPMQNAFDKINAAIDAINSALGGGSTGQILKKESDDDFDTMFENQYPTQDDKKGKALISSGIEGGEFWGSPVFINAAIKNTLENTTSYTTSTLTAPNDGPRKNKLTISLTLFAVTEKTFKLTLFKNGSPFKEINFANNDTTTDLATYSTVISYSFADLNGAANDQYYIGITVGTSSDFIESTFIIESSAV